MSDRMSQHRRRNTYCGWEPAGPDRDVTVHWCTRVVEHKDGSETGAYFEPACEPEMVLLDGAFTQPECLLDVVTCKACRQALRERQRAAAIKRRLEIVAAHETWHVSDDDDKIRVIATPAREPFEEVCTMSHIGECAEADALLIAAAPMLLRACKWAAATLAGDGMPAHADRGRQLLRLAQEAIARAEGSDVPPDGGQFLGSYAGRRDGS